VKINSIPFLSTAKILVVSSLLLSNLVFAQDSGGGFFKDLLGVVMCGPGGKMCDQTYNPNAKNAMVENPEQLLKFINAADAFLNGQRAEPIGERNKTFVANKSKIAVTAVPPPNLNPPLDNDAFQKVMKTNGGLALAIQGYLQKQTSSIPQLKAAAESGDPWAQMFYGLAYGDSWTGIANPAESCRWIKEAASTGVSSARFFISKKAYIRADCFSETPTLEQAKIWAELASMSNDEVMKQESRELINTILKEQLKGGK
jgi:hypothetical protein